MARRGCWTPGTLTESYGKLAFMSASSPASSGPAGPQFEGQIGAHYLLSLLTGAEPHGLPGAGIERVEFQRAAESHPLDDIVVHARDGNGSPSVLEIQVKRSLQFTRSDQKFGGVVAQIAQASQQPGFFDTRHELAVAVGRAPLKVQGPCQDVLVWARQMSCADTFMTRIERRHSANDDVRSFVDAFRTHLKHVDAAHDDETVWRLLSRLQILHFDFTAQGSVCEAWQRERAAHALHPDDAGKADALWRCLVELAIGAAASGGDRDRDRLLQDVGARGFRLASDCRYAPARSALAEDARHALEDIADRVGNVRLMRGKHVVAVRSALDQGRYVEIRGEPGVGKSGLLKRFAEELSSQSGIIVLTPGRVKSGGWGAMRAALGFNGTARALLVDLAVSGGAALFIDSLDSYSEDERLTVVDLVREAAEIPGFSVIATTRYGFGDETDEAERLPADAFERLGRVVPVTIGELATDEVTELRDAAPELAPLLADTHPARSIARNLFRLERLIRRTACEPRFRTEIDMAKDWWGTADGKKEGRRERARLLTALATQALESATLNADTHPAAAVDALIGSGTLRDLGGDRMAFRHDTLRDWAVANLLFEEPDIAGRLPLDRLAPARLARGFELAARMKLERAANDAIWRSLLDSVSREGMHGSWRRVALLAVVRSEIGIELLNRVTESILAEDARLLSELVRTVQAVEVQSLSEHLARFGATAPENAAGLYLPSDPSWIRLTCWLLALDDDLPEAAVADVAAFFKASCAELLHNHEIGHSLAHWFHRRLERIEAHRSDPFVSELRSDFLAVCPHAPSLAARYLRSLVQCQWHDKAIRTVWTFSSFIARAAPQELADLTVAMLIPSREDRKPRFPSGIPVSLSDLSSSGSDDRGRDPFGSSELAFVPPSPKQGPFLALLDHAPATGLKLVCQLVDHAISVRSQGQPHGADAMTVAFADGGRVFSSLGTYTWSRDWGNGDSCVQSALMALEAWAHRRVDDGEEVDTVLADVLPPAGGPAAYLLVAVDLVLSHWSKSRKVAIPFLACPELLCLDLQRTSGDAQTKSDVFGIDALFGTTDDPSGSDGLKAPPSRQLSLHSRLGCYAISGPLEMRTEIAGLLQQTVERLGPYGEDMDRRDPEFMAAHALNLLDPENWRETSTMGSDGEPVGAWEYVSPPEENGHLERLSASAFPWLADRSMQCAILLAVEEPSHSSPEFASQVMGWVLQPAPPTTNDTWDKVGHRNLAIVSAAVIVMRDGGSGLRARRRAWARGVFMKALAAENQNGFITGSNIRFSPAAMAFIGTVQLLREGIEPADVRVLLEAASRRDLLAASGFRVVVDAIETIDDRLPRALLRTAFASCIRLRRRREDSGGERAADIERRVRFAMDRELGWLFDGHEEPDWPEFPMASPMRRSSLRIPSICRGLPEDIGRPEARQRTDEDLDDRSAALWLTSASCLFDVESRPWLRDLAQSYAEWTAVANGSDFKPRGRIEKTPSKWNAAYYDLVARCLPGLAAENSDRLALTPILSLPEKSFFDAAGHFLRSLDRVYFRDGGLVEAEAVRIRASLADRFSGSFDWTGRGCDPSASIEVHMGSAVAAFFFNDWDRIPPSSCYLRPTDIARIEPFLPVLERLVVNGPGGFVASLVLDLVEVSPKPEHLSFIVAAAEAWLTAHPCNTKFWIDTKTAQRLCAVITRIGARESFSCRDPSLRDRVGNIVSALVGLGVAAAGQLEQDLVSGAHE